MKIKNIFTIVMLLALTLLGACTNESEVVLGPDNKAGTIDKGDYVFTLEVNGVTSGTPKTYAPQAATDAEKKVSNLLAVLFEQTSKKYLGAIEPQYPLTVGSTSDANADTKLQAVFKVPATITDHNTAYSFFLVANITDSDFDAEVNRIATANSTTAAELTATQVLDNFQVTQAPDVNDKFVMIGADPTDYNVVPMTDVTVVQGGLATAKEVTELIYLRRLSAKVEVVKKDAQLANLEITKVTFKNRQKHSNLKRKSTHLDSGKEDKEYTAAPFTMYGYENSTDGETSLIIESTYNGIALKPLEITFDKDVAGKDVKKLIRNHWYRVVLTRDDAGVDITPDDPTIDQVKVLAKLVVNDWEFDEVIYNEPYLQGVPTILSVTKTGTTGAVTAVSPFTSIGLNHLETLFEIEVDNPHVETGYKITSGEDWLSMTSAGAPTTYGVKQKYNFKATENKGLARTATIEFYNKVNSNKTIIVTVKQEGVPLTSPIIKEIKPVSGSPLHGGTHEDLTVAASEYSMRIVMDATSQPANIESSVSWLTVSADGSNFAVKVDKNTSETTERTGKITLTNKLDAGKITVINVTQSKYVKSVITRWAKLNVGELNKFANGSATEGSPSIEAQQNGEGTKYYQWGRNIAFDYANQTTVSQASSPTDPKAWGYRFIVYNSSYGYNWYRGGSDTDTWKDIVQKTQAASGAPTGYSGNNGGDPCPPGYRMPTTYEIRTLFSTQGTFTTASDVAEQLDPEFTNGGYQDYKTDYKAVGGIQFALKMKGTEHATAVMYRWDAGSNSMEITSRKAEAATTIDDIAKTDYFNSADGRIYIPASGYLSSYNGTAYYRGTNGYVWSSSAYSGRSGWYLLVHSGYVRGQSYNYRAYGFSVRCVRL